MNDSVSEMWRIARRLEAARLRTYRRIGKPLPPMLFFTDPGRTPDPEDVVRGLPAGSGVVFRAFGEPGGLARGRVLAKAARRRGVFFLVGADVPMAIALRADGVHLPERLAGRAGDHRRLRRRFLLTAAAHSLPAALKAGRAGVDAMVISPVFASASPSARAPMGRFRFAKLVRAIPAPVYALGGVTARSARRLAGSGAAGFAAVDGLNR